MRHAAAPRLLARALQDPVAAVRLAAAQALSRMDLREAEAGLGELARSDGDPAVRRAAQRALIR
jgi:HEAT repeat protein